MYLEREVCEVRKKLRRFARSVHIHPHGLQRGSIERQGCYSEAFGIEILRGNRIKISQSTCKGTLTLIIKSLKGDSKLEHAKRKKSNAKVEGKS